MVYIVITVHNRLAATLSCFDCLKKQTYFDYQIILVDDGSTDGTAETILQRYPETIILQGDGNLWWTGAMAKGVDYVLQCASDEDYVLSLNNDVTFAEDYLQVLIDTSIRYHGAVVGSLCRDAVPPYRIHDAGVTMQWKKYRYGQVTYDPAQRETTAGDTISGRGVLIPVTTFKTVGNFAHRFLPHYGADYEFGFRVKRAGIPMVVSYAAIVFLDDTLTGFRPSEKVLSYRDEWRRLFSIKSPANVIVHLKIIWRHCPGWKLKLYNIIYFTLGNAYMSLRNTVFYSGILLGRIYKKS